MNSALENARSVDMQLRSIMEQEDSFLIVLPEWVEPSLSETRGSIKFVHISVDNRNRE